MLKAINIAQSKPVSQVSFKSEFKKYSNLDTDEKNNLIRYGNEIIVKNQEALHEQNKDILESLQHLGTILAIVNQGLKYNEKSRDAIADLRKIGHKNNI